MVIEIDSGTWVETQDMTSVQLSQDGDTFAVIGGMTYRATRFGFEELLRMLQQREAQTTDVAY